MKQNLLSMTAVVLALGAAAPASAQAVLSGDTRLACEALLCLSSGTRPSECSPALSRYFGINKRKFSDTIKARLNFLDLCPVSNETPEMAALVAAISRGAGRCDATLLNRTLVMWDGWDEGHFVISDRLPADCSAYVNHAYTDFATSTLPRYVGTPERGGYWVEARDYERALAKYNARIQAEDAKRRERFEYGN